MVEFLWIVVMVFAAVVGEVVCCNVGVLFPGSFFVAFYLVVSRNWLTGFAAGAVACTMAEVFLGRAVTALPIMLLLVVYAEFWRTHGDRRYSLMQAAPGALTGFFYLVYYRLGESIGFGWHGVADSMAAFAWFTLWQTTVAAIAFPIFLAVLDLMARGLELNTFCIRRKFGVYP